MRPSARAAAVALWLALAAAPAAAEFPAVIDSCGRPERFAAPARRAVANDVNNVETLLTLGVEDSMAGYSGLNGKPVAPALQPKLAGLRELARQYPSLELLVGAGADFYVAGWGYGMRIGGEVTPETLAAHGIRSYAIRESCIRLGPRDGIALDDMYEDVRALGRAFGVAARAEALIDGFRARIAAVAAALDPGARRPPVFVYDSGDDAPLSTGRFAMPTALIAAAGGRNVMDDVGSSWTRVSWEAVIARAPELIVVIDYGPIAAGAKIAFLESLPALAGVPAIRARRYLVLSYEAATPGVRNIDAVEALARALHPERF